MNEQLVQRVLVAARLRLAQGWCQGAPARLECGNPCWPEHEAATQWCVLGAIMATLDTIPETAKNPQLRYNVRAQCVTRLARALGIRGRNRGGQIARWNDAPDRTQVEVLAMLDAAIAQLQEASA